MTERSLLQYHVWNRLPTDLKLAHMTSSFTRNLKSLFFSVAYNEQH